MFSQHLIAIIPIISGFNYHWEISHLSNRSSFVEDLPFVFDLFKQTFAFLMINVTSGDFSYYRSNDCFLWTSLQNQNKTSYFLFKFAFLFSSCKCSSEIWYLNLFAIAILLFDRLIGFIMFSVNYILHIDHIQAFVHTPIFLPFPTYHITYRNFVCLYKI